MIAVPFMASAHEVYVLSAQEIHQAITMTSPNPFLAVSTQELKFLEWGAMTAVLLLIVLRFSLSKLFERIFDPILIKLKRYAPLAGRLTLGLSLIASGYYHALFGPELPLSAFFGAGSEIVSVILMFLGAVIILGWYTRPAAVVALCIFAYSIFKDETYMLTYANYLGEIFLALILGSGVYSIDHVLKRGRVVKLFGITWEKYSFFILRVLYGIGLFFASFYAKFLHSNLALDTVNDYHLTNYFHFTPLFLVLGAFIVEALIGLCFAAGFEIRFAAIVFTIFLTMSILFFGEVVWPHIILFGVNIALFLHGYDEYTLEKWLFPQKKRSEPVL